MSDETNLLKINQFSIEQDKIPQYGKNVYF